MLFFAPLESDGCVPEIPQINYFFNTEYTEEAQSYTEVSSTLRGWHNHLGFCPADSGDFRGLDIFTRVLSLFEVIFLTQSSTEEAQSYTEVSSTLKGWHNHKYLSRRFRRYSRIRYFLMDIVCAFE